MDDKDKELLTLQFTRMEEKINTISSDVKETKKDVKNLDKRVRDIEELVRTNDINDKLITSRLDKLERLTSVSGFFTEHPKILFLTLLALALIFLNNDWLDLLDIFK